VSTKTKTADILHKFVIEAPPAKIYRAITEKDGLAGWWTTDVKAEPKLGSIDEFGFYGHTIVFEMRITELKPTERVAWLCQAGPPEWIGTELSFELTPAEKGSTIKFEHRGWASTEGDFGHCNFHWAGYFLSLKSLVETGKGDPNTG
jgi:uncharacterized protein YndB with AHSA1/START domain